MDSGGGCDDSRLVSSFENDASREPNEEGSGDSCLKGEGEGGLCTTHGLEKVSDRY